MADSPDDPRRPPKYLPRIKYTPPEELKVEGEEDEEEDVDGSESSPEPPRKKKSPKVATPGTPVEAPKPKLKSSNPPANPPRAGLIDRSIPANPPRSGASEPKPKAKPRDEGDERPAGALLEQTPQGETFEARRRVRLIVGGVAGSVILLAVFLLYRAIRPDPEDVAVESPPGNEPQFVPTAPRKRSPAEQDVIARGLMAEAKKLEKSGKINDALNKINRVLAECAEAPSAKLASDAKQRHAQGFPLFVAGAAVVATKAQAKDGEPEPPAPADETPPAEVVATPPVTPSPVAVPDVPPPAPTVPVSGVRPEPRRETGVGLSPSKVAARALPAGFHAREAVGVHASGWPLEITCDKDGASMILIPGDVFVQGRDDGKPEERPAHQVQLSPYYIDQHEITGRQYALCRGGSGDDRPMTGVSLNEAREYARWAGKSIPTEAQWEMAARATDGRLHPWGNARPEWDRPRQPKQIDPVMSFSSDLSPYGVYDLAGNAWEWTSDWFDTKYYASLKGRTPVDPTGPASGKGRLAEIVIKGGASDWDASWRSGMRPEAKLAYLGFRCVLNLNGSHAAVPPATNRPAPAQAAPSGAVPF